MCQIKIQTTVKMFYSLEICHLLEYVNHRINCIDSVQFSFQIFNAARQLSHIEAAPDKSGLVLLDYWVGLKRCLVIIHN